MTYAEAIQYLYDLRLFGTKLGLENTVKLAEMAENPHRQLRFIHVAGTNGKGSTCAMLESVYRAAGYRTGLFTSPHLVRFGERIRVCGQQVPDADLLRLVARYKKFVERFPPTECPTFFEVTTLIALEYFAEQQCEIVIWETGMGGRLDATNIVTPLLSIITNIAFDHERWLGSSLADIAREKAGIIKPRVPSITMAEGEALEVIRDVAERCGSPLKILKREEALPIPLPLAGDHQQLNAALAVAAVEILQATLPVSPDALGKGLATVHWPGRLQLESVGSGKVLFDGAHNVAGVETLARALESRFAGEQPKTLIIGMLKDKNWQAMCGRLAPFAARIYVCPVASERTADVSGLAAACREANPSAVVREAPSLREALRESTNDPFRIITGSLHFIGEAMELLGVEVPSGENERKLNETHEPSSKR